MPMDGAPVAAATGLVDRLIEGAGTDAPRTSPGKGSRK